MAKLQDVVHVQQVAAALATYLSPLDVACLVVWVMDLDVHDAVQYLVQHAPRFEEVQDSVLACAAAYGCKTAVRRLLHSGGLRNYVAMRPPLPRIEDTSVLPAIVPASGVYEAAKRGDLDAIQWLHSLTQYPEHEAMMFAAVNCHLNIVEWTGNEAIAAPRDPLRPYALDMHCLRGEVDGKDQILVVSWTTQFIDQARSERVYRKFLATRAHGVDLVRRGRGWAKELEYIGAMDFVAERGDLKLLQAMHQDTDYKWSCTAAAMDRAAEAGHLHVLEWLALNREEGCTEDALNRAARRGHLEIAQWLHTEQKLRPTSDTLLAALEGGRLDLVQWVLTVATELLFDMPSPARLVEAACVSSNRFAVLKWLEDAHNIRLATGPAMSLVLSHNDVETAQWLAESSGGDRNIKQWNLVIAKWLSYEFSLWYNGAVTKAALNGHASVVEWLAEAGPLHVIEKDTLWKCAMRGHLDIVELLLKKPVHLPRDIEFVSPNWRSFHDATLDDVDAKRIGHRRWEWYQFACNPAWARAYVALWLKHRPEACKQAAWLPRWARACGYDQLCLEGSA